jgi:8-oxo-dGTP pyrophosphatase MutT (NUDIX family)
MWLPPGGHCEPDEDPVQAVLREGHEETGLDLELVTTRDVLALTGRGPAVLPPPEVILVEDIRIEGQPFHQHIDHVYVTRPVGPVDLAAPMPGGPPHYWATAAELAAPFSLPAPDGRLVEVAEDVRLLGLRAIAAAGQ